MKNKILILIVFSLVLSLPVISYGQDKQINTQTDSVNVLVLQNKKNPENIEILKSGKRVNIKIKSTHNKGKNISIRGKLTAIKDTSLIIDNKYRVKLRSDTILDYRFNNHPFRKLILGTAGIGVFLFGVEFAGLMTVLIPEYPGLAIFYGSIAIVGDVMLYEALTKNKHPANCWNVSIKKVKKHK